MSWLGSHRPNAKIHLRNEYYFFTPERVAKPYLRLYSPEQITVTSDEIKRPPVPVAGKSNVVKIIPRSLIQGLNPSKDFVVKTRLTYGRTSFILGDLPLGEILTVNNFGYPDLLTHAFISSGEHCLDLGDHLAILRISESNQPVPKFKDAKVMEKLTAALIEVIDKNGWAEFTLEEDGRVQVKVSITFSEAARRRFTGKDVGRICLPTSPLPEEKEYSL